MDHDLLTARRLPDGNSFHTESSFIRDQTKHVSPKRKHSIMHANDEIANILTGNVFVEHVYSKHVSGLM